MSIFDKLTERVGDFFDEVMLPEPVRRAHDEATAAMAASQYERALAALRPSLIAHPNVARTHHLIGMCHFHEGHWGDAIASFERALAIKEVASSHFYAGLASEQLQRWHDVQRHFGRALSLGEELPFDYDLHFGLGRAYRALDRTDKAIKELRAALRKSPTAIDASVVLAQTLVDLGRLDEADAALSVLDDPKAQPEAAFVRAQIEEARSNLPASIDAYERAMSVPDLRERAARGAAHIALQLDDLDRADRALAAAADASTVRGQLAEKRGDFTTAESHFRAAIDEDRTDLEAHLGLGRIALKHGDVDTAAAHFVKVFSATDPAHRQQAWLGTGRCHFEAGDMAGARRLLEQARELGGPLVPEISVWLGRTALELGDAAEAMVALRSAQPQATGTVARELAAVLDAALNRIAPSWDDLPTRVTEPEGIIDLLSILLEYLGRDARLSDFLGPTQRLHTAMNAPLSLAIVGEFNAGKSTIVNALVGDDVFPTGVLPTTAHTGIVRWGPRKAARVIYVDDTREEQSLQQARVTMKTNADQVGRVEFTHPHPALRLVHYWDTPGFNALEERHETTAAEALQRAEAILWVMDANQVLSQTEFERIETLPDGDERLVVVINKIDRLGPLDDRGDDVAHLLEYVEDNLQGRTAGVFAISARDATSEDDSVRDASGFAQFTTFLDERVVQRAGRIKTLEVTRQLSSLVFTLEAFQNGLVSRYGALAGEVRDIQSWLAGSESDRGARQAREEIAAVNEWVEHVLRGVEEEIDDAMRPTTGWTGKRALSDDDRGFILSLVIKRLDRVADASSGRVEQQLATIEGELAERLDPVMRGLSVADSRAVQRRLDGFYDEARVVRLLWQERVYGALRERADACVDAYGERVLDSVVAAQSDRSVWQTHLRTLIPTIDEAFGNRIERWYAAFFEAASRLCDRVRNDLELLELEAKTRYDVAPIRALVPMDTDLGQDVEEDDGRDRE